MTLKISREILYHYNCGYCQKWWSVADIEPIPGDTVCCPHCSICHKVSPHILTGKDFVLGDNKHHPTLAELSEMIRGSDRP